MSFDSDRFERYAQELNDAANTMSVELSETATEKLLKYLFLLEKWNKAFNLTAVRDTDEMLSRHLVDSLSIVPYIKGSRILDVGTGAGLPGIPLAILFPECHFTLVDSNIKKTRFITQSLIELGLKNVEVQHARVETLKFDEPFQQVVSRAFASLEKMVTLCHPHLANNGQFLAMKGLDMLDEKNAMPAQFQVEKTINLMVPGCEAQRHLIIIGFSSD